MEMEGEMRFVLASVLMVIGMWIGVSPSEALACAGCYMEECYEDMDCGECGVCDMGSCFFDPDCGQEPAAIDAFECTEDTDCGACSLCVDGICMADDFGTCEDDETLACTFDVDCAIDQLCASGVCVMAQQPASEHGVQQDLSTPVAPAHLQSELGIEQPSWDVICAGTHLDDDVLALCALMDTEPSEPAAEPAPQVNHALSAQLIDASYLAAGEPAAVGCSATDGSSGTMVLYGAALVLVSLISLRRKASHTHAA